MEGDFCLVQGGLQFGLVQFRDDLAFFDLGIEVHEDFGDVAGNLGAHFHLVHGLQGAGGGNDGGKGQLGHGGADRDAYFACRRISEEKELHAYGNGRKHKENDEYLQKFLHGSVAKIKSILVTNTNFDAPEPQSVAFFILPPTTNYQPLKPLAPSTPKTYYLKPNTYQ